MDLLFSVVKARLVPPKIAAERLGRSESTVRKMLDNGDLRGFKDLQPLRPRRYVEVDERGLPLGRDGHPHPLSGRVPDVGAMMALAELTARVDQIEQVLRTPSKPPGGGRSVVAAGGILKGKTCRAVRPNTHKQDSGASRALSLWKTSVSLSALVGHDGPIGRRLFGGEWPA